MSHYCCAGAAYINDEAVERTRSAGKAYLRRFTLSVLYGEYIRRARMETLEKNHAFPRELHTLMDIIKLGRKYRFIPKKQ